MVVGVSVLGGPQWAHIKTSRRYRTWTIDGQQSTWCVREPCQSTKRINAQRPYTSISSITASSTSSSSSSQTYYYYLLISAGATTTTATATAHTTTAMGSYKDFKEIQDLDHS